MDSLLGIETSIYLQLDNFVYVIFSKFSDDNLNLLLKQAPTIFLRLFFPGFPLKMRIAEITTRYKKTDLQAVIKLILNKVIVSKFFYVN